MGKSKAISELFPVQVLNSRGGDIFITTGDSLGDIDEDYVFDAATLKPLLLGLEHKIPTYLCGHHGTGKSTLVTQTCARVGRRVLRVQHSLNMLESDVVGDWRVKSGETYFSFGALPLAMRHGLVYLADEYDRAPPGVLSVYQSVLEGEPLFIKEAPEDQRLIHPHSDFRFVATGNTNGTGDDTGQYIGALAQDVANYSRFGVMIRVGYLSAKQEANLLSSKANVTEDDAERLVDWATRVRNLFDSGKLRMTVGPRELLYAAKIGALIGNFSVSIKLSITNRFDADSRMIADELAQRFFGGEV